MSIKQFVAVLSLLLVAMPSSHAATSTAAVAVSAIVAPFCQLGSPTEQAGTHTLAVACDMSVPYTVTYNEMSVAGLVSTTITY